MKIKDYLIEWMEKETGDYGQFEDGTIEMDAEELLEFLAVFDETILAIYKKVG